MTKTSITTSALNRLLNLMDEMQPVMPAVEGEALEQAITAPAAEVPAELPIEGALVAKGLGL